MERLRARLDATAGRAADRLAPLAVWALSLPLHFAAWLLERSR